MPKAAADPNNSRPRKRQTRDYDPATAANVVSQQWRTVLHTVVIPTCMLAPGEYERNYQPRMVAGKLVCPICPRTQLKLSEENTHCRHEHTDKHLNNLQRVLNRPHLEPGALVAAVRADGTLHPSCPVCHNRYSRPDTLTRHFSTCGGYKKTAKAVQASGSGSSKASAPRNGTHGRKTRASPPARERQRPEPYPRPEHPRTQRPSRYAPIAPSPAPGPSTIGARPHPRSAPQPQPQHPAASSSAPAPRPQPPSHRATRSHMPPPADPRWKQERAVAPCAPPAATADPRRAPEPPAASPVSLHTVWPSDVPSSPESEAPSTPKFDLDASFDEIRRVLGPALCQALADSAVADVERIMGGGAA